VDRDGYGREVVGHTGPLEKVAQVTLRNRDAVQIPLNRAAIKRVHVGRWADHYLLPLDFAHARQVANFLIGMESSCRDSRQNPTRRQGNVEGVWIPTPSNDRATGGPTESGPDGDGRLSV
jgi:hypothetical protein